MKRSRDDDVFENSHPKRPAISSGVEQTGLAQMSMSSAQRLTTTDALSYLKTVKEIFQDRRDKYEDFLDVMKDFKAQRIETSGVILRVKELFKGNRDLILGFNTFLPKGYEITLPLEDEPFLKKKPVEFEEAIGFVNKIKTRFQGDDHVYKAFLHILNMYRKDSKSITEVYREVSVLFQDHADLLVDFTHFLPDTSGTASVRYASVRNHNINGDESAFRNKVKVRLQDPEIDEKFSDCIHAFIRKMFTADHFRELVYSLLGTHSDVVEACEDFVAYIEKNGSLRNNKRVFRKADRDGDDHDSEDTEKNKDRDFRERDRQDRGLVSNTKDVLGQRESYANKEKFMAKPIQELDLSNCESCTPSYRHLPENYPIPAASWRTEIGAEVLNDHWVSVTSGSEDYSFKHMRKNQYEESLFRCEDDRFELDMLLESVNATAKRVEELLYSMNAHTNKTESSLCVEDHLTALNLRCIERLYGDHGLDVMDVLRKNAPLALPVILTRLKQKQEEWTRCRADFNKVWADIYAKNYHKSLDHRSFYFKQQDAKNLSTKALLAEIKEISENNQNEDEEVLSIGAGHTQPVKPHMEFHYPDPEVQEDVCELIKYSCGEVCTPEQSGEVLRIWRTFLEPLLDVCSLSPCARVNGYAVTTNNHIKQNLKNVGEENSNLANESAYCKPLDMSENGDMLIPSEDNGSSNCGVTCNAPQSPAGEMNVIDDNTLATLQGNDQENSVCGTVMIPNKESQVGVIAKLATCSIDIVPEEVKAQKHNEETEGHGKAEREEGELSPNKNLEDNNFSASENTDIKVKQSPCQSDPITTVIGREEMHIETGEETDANVDDEGRGSAQGSSESENDSENGNVTGTESANGEECYPKNPIGDGKLDKKTESEGEADSLADVHDTERMSPLSDHSLRTVKPLKLIVPTSSHGRERNSRIFYGNDSLYLLFRLHQMLYERMLTAKSHALSPENKWKISIDANPTELYARFKDALRSLLNGSSDNAKFEDECRAIIGTQSYILFTLDKLIHKFIKQLQIIATEDENTGLLQLSKYEGTRSFETFTDAVYHVNARFVLPEDSLYRIECLPSPARLTIQSLKSEHNRIDPIAVFMDPYFESYLNDELLSVGPEITEKPGVFLKRNKKIYLTEDGDSDTGKALEDIILLNGVEMKVNCISLKISYVLDTEDFFYRPKTRRKALYGSCASIQTSTGQRGAKRRKLNL